MKARHKDTGEMIDLAEEGIIAHDGRRFNWSQVDLIPEPIDDQGVIIPGAYISRNRYTKTNVLHVSETCDAIQKLKVGKVIVQVRNDTSQSGA